MKKNSLLGIVFVFLGFTIYDCSEERIEQDDSNEEKIIIEHSDKILKEKDNKKRQEIGLSFIEDVYSNEADKLKASTNEESKYVSFNIDNVLKCINNATFNDSNSIKFYAIKIKDLNKIHVLGEGSLHDGMKFRINFDILFFDDYEKARRIIIYDLTSNAEYIENNHPGHKLADKSWHKKIDPNNASSSIIVLMSNMIIKLRYYDLRNDPSIMNEIINDGNVVFEKIINYISKCN